MSAKADVRVLTVALAGQPNVGKSTIFNMLTGLSQHVGNWPGKTVERREGVFSSNGALIRIVDLPGTYGLSATSEEGRIARDYLIKEPPDVVVIVANAAAIERNLYLLAELLALPTPLVLGLNMMDVATAQKLRIAPHVLEAALGLPVVPLVASRNQGVAELLATAVQLAQKPETFHPTRPEIGERHKHILAELRTLLNLRVPLPYQTEWIALKLLEGDTEISALAQAWLPDRDWRRVATLLAQHEDAVLDVAGGRYAWIVRMIAAAVERPPLGQIGLTERIDRFALHPVGGMLVLLAVFGLTFWFTFTLGTPVQAFLERHVITPLQAGAIAALAFAPPWVGQFVANGVLGGAGLVITFVPLLIFFYATFGFLEDTGYLARVAYLMDRFMHCFGLHGKSLLPLFMGFGCNVPAVMGARVIESGSGRLLTILLAPLVPCSARLAVLAFLTPLFFGRHAPWVSAALVALNIAVLAAVGIVLHHTLFRGERVAFIMELPLYHRPSPRSIALFVWNNVSAFLRKAGTMILIVATIVWVLGYFPGADIEHSYLARFGQVVEPVGSLLGLDWRLTVALLTSFVAKENAIATLGVLYKSSSGSLVEALSTFVTPASALSFMVATMLFIPCIATVAVMHQETRSWRWTCFSVALSLVIALLAGMAIYQGAIWIGGSVRHA